MVVRKFRSSSWIRSQKKPEEVGFQGKNEFTRRTNTDGSKIDEFGNYTAPGGIAMPTQSSGGLTKKNNEDISSLDIFEGEGAVVTAYSESGFVINEEYTEGSILAFPKKYWSWNATSMSDITIENLAPIWLHNPVPRTYFDRLHSVLQFH